MNKKALFVSYVFPPVSSPGAVRVERMAHHLSSGSLEVGVLTCSNPYSSMVSQSSTSVSDSYKLYRIRDVINKTSFSGSSSAERRKSVKGRLAQFFSAFFFPDNNVSWLPSVLTNASLFRGYDVVIGSSPSPTNLLLATLLSRVCRMKLILEYRDLWTAAGRPSDKGRLRFLFERGLERLLVRCADGIVTVSDADRRVMIEFCKNSGGERAYAVIRNGYDEVALSNAIERYAPQQTNKEYVISYTGSFYKGERDPSSVIIALNRLVSTGLVEPGEVVFNIYGHIEPEISSLVDSVDTHGVVEFKGMASRDDVYDAMLHSHLLLAITRRSSSAIGEMTTKVYEYVGSGRPVLCLAPSGFELVNTMNEIEGVSCFDIDAVDDVADFLKVELEAWQSATDKSPRSFVREEKFSRRQAALDMGEFIHDL